MQHNSTATSEATARRVNRVREDQTHAQGYRCWAGEIRASKLQNFICIFIYRVALYPMRSRCYVLAKGGLCVFYVLKGQATPGSCAGNREAIDNQGVR